MKKSFAIAALTIGAILLGTNNVQAQTKPVPATAETEVNIELSDVITIDPTSVATTKPVNFSYATAADYYTEKTVTVLNALKVTSTKPFGVTVIANGTDFETSDKSSKIPVDVMTITASGGNMTGTPGGGVLSNLTDVILMDGAALGSELTLDLEFTIPADQAKSNKILGKPAGTYTQKVTYTATTN